MDTDELIDEFGLEETKAVDTMLKRGYCLQDDLAWLKPDVYHIPTALEVRAFKYLCEVHGYKMLLSVDISKPIKRMCELKDSVLLRCHMKVKHEERLADVVRRTKRRVGRRTPQIAKKKKAKGAV